MKLKQVIYVALLSGMAVFLIARLIPESNFKEMIMPLVAGLCVLVIGLIFNRKYNKK
ncbi:hypothetical protein [Bacillus sp. AFS017336]|uniref:hypothetical protein n=1 Tax=Bacillus sp. AFS017336 TaxID=2033489 RepID=UPI0015CF2B47|nr:hypothetical protein [Bacillus sp. AFS017336]